MIVKNFFMIKFTAILPICVAFAVQASPIPEKTVVLGVVESLSKQEFETSYLPLLKEQMSACKTCEVKNYSPYNDKGEFDPGQLRSRIEQAGKESKVLLLGYNTRMNSELSPVVETIKKVIQEGLMVVADVGVANPEEDGAPIAKTLMGQIPEVVLLGEVNERERLIANSYFGPQMLTAVRPPRDHIGKGYGSIFFVSRLVQSYHRRSVSEWRDHFHSVKSKSRRIWPPVEDFFKN